MYNHKLSDLYSKDVIKNNIWTRMHVDIFLFISVISMAFLGLMILYNSGNSNLYYVKKQAIFIFIGLILMLLFAQINPFYIKYYAKFLYIACLLGLILVALIGVKINGSRRWINFYLFSIQPSIFTIGILPIFISYLLDKKPFSMLKSKDFIKALIFIIIPAILVFIQPDLGTSILVMVSGLIVLFLAGLPWKIVFGSLISLIISIPLIWLFILHDYHKKRILTILNPESDPYGIGWNTIQSQTAIGSGGLLGKGWGNSTQSSLDFLPESHTDFIFAVIAEEFGFIGTLLIFTLYLFIIIRCFFIITKLKTSFGYLLCSNITFIFTLYSFINIGMATGLLPVVGLPLPLISYGGSSLMSIMIGFGIIMSFATHKN